MNTDESEQSTLNHDDQTVLALDFNYNHSSFLLNFGAEGVIVIRRTGLRDVRGKNYNVP